MYVPILVLKQDFLLKFKKKTVVGCDTDEKISNVVRSFEGI